MSIIKRLVSPIARRFRITPFLPVCTPHMTRHAPPMYRTFTSTPTPTIKGVSAREAYLFVYTCKVCGERSERKISKQAYHHGVVLVKCPGCEKNHLVADNLKWFDDKPINIQSIMEGQGESVVTGVAETVGDMMHVEGLTEAEVAIMVKNRLQVT